MNPFKPSGANKWQFEEPKPLVIGSALWYLIECSFCQHGSMLGYLSKLVLELGDTVNIEEQLYWGSLVGNMCHSLCKPSTLKL